MKKEYRKLLQMLIDDGFSILPGGNHHYIEKDGCKMLITRNVKDAKSRYKIICSDYRKELSKKGE